MVKTYIISKYTFYRDGHLMVEFKLYRRVLEDGTDLGWSYSMGHKALATSEGPYNDIEHVRQQLIAKAADLGVNKDDIDYLY